MSELLAQHPEATVQALQGAGVCGPGTPSKALAQCPADRYCALPGGGELCVYGIAEVGRMNQISRAELSAALVQPTAPAAPTVPEARAITEMEVLSVAVVFIAGIAIGRYWPRARKDRPAPPKAGE